MENLVLGLAVMATVMKKFRKRYSMKRSCLQETRYSGVTAQVAHINSMPRLYSKREFKIKYLVNRLMGKTCSKDGSRNEVIGT